MTNFFYLYIVFYQYYYQYQCNAYVYHSFSTLLCSGLPLINRQLSASEGATLSGVNQVAYYDCGG